MEKKEFIQKNSIFWNDYNLEDFNEKILIESQTSVFTIQILGYYANIICLAKKYTPQWIECELKNPDLIKSYNKHSSYAKISKIGRVKKFFIRVIVFKLYVKALLGFRITKFKIKGIKIGDLLYDEYLKRYSAPTIKKIDKKFLIILFEVCITFFEFDIFFKTSSYKAVLASHRVGVKSGLLIRVAAKNKIDTYSTFGQRYGTLCLTKPNESPIIYGYTPSLEDIKKILNKKEINKIFENFMSEYSEGKYTADAKNAYLPTSKVTKNSFCLNYDLDNNKPLIFIMLHAFTDFPHSHIEEEMPFKDYFDWFLKTLNFAEKTKKYNWVFKQHPSIKHYKTDIKYDEIFKLNNNHIKYIDETNNINTLNVSNIADLIITCIGSAGFEIPALGKTNSLCPAPNYYNKIGFNINAKSQFEYFNILNNIEAIPKMNDKNNLLAKATFLFIVKYSRVENNAIPQLSHDEQLDPNMDKWYYDRVNKLYITKKKEIKKEIFNYSSKIKSASFTSLKSI